MSGGDGPPEIVLLGQSRFAAVRDENLGDWLVALIGEVAPAADSFAVRLVGERTMRAFNRDFRGVDRPTDVLSFPGAGGPDGVHLGDCVVCVPRAVTQAGERGHSAVREIRLLILHGLLHCLGYDHEHDAGEMDSVERRLRRRWLRVA